MAISRLDMSDAGRGEWGSHYEYFLTSLGLAVGLGNIWRSAVCIGLRIGASNEGSRSFHNHGEGPHMGIYLVESACLLVLLHLRLSASRHY